MLKADVDQHDTGGHSHDERDVPDSAAPDSPDEHATPNSAAPDSPDKCLQTPNSKRANSPIQCDIEITPPRFVWPMPKKAAALTFSSKGNTSHTQSLSTSSTLSSTAKDLNKKGSKKRSRVEAVADENQRQDKTLAVLATQKHK